MVAGWLACRSLSAADYSNRLNDALVTCLHMRVLTSTTVPLSSLVLVFVVVIII